MLKQCKRLQANVLKSCQQLVRQFAVSIFKATAHLTSSPERAAGWFFFYIFSFLAGNRCLLLNLEGQLSHTIISAGTVYLRVLKQTNALYEASWGQGPVWRHFHQSQWFVVEFWALLTLYIKYIKSAAKFPSPASQPYVHILHLCDILQIPTPAMGFWICNI